MTERQSGKRHPSSGLCTEGEQLLPWDPGQPLAPGPHHHRQNRETDNTREGGKCQHQGGVKKLPHYHDPGTWGHTEQGKPQFCTLPLWGATAVTGTSLTVTDDHRALHGFTPMTAVHRDAQSCLGK